MKITIRTLAVVLLVAACTEQATSPPIGDVVRPRPASDVMPTANSPCTVHWASGVNGSWYDPARWNPAGVPDGNASVCIDAAGTYTVTLDPVTDATPVDILALDVGGTGATPTLRLSGAAATLNVTQGIEVRAGARIDLNNSGGAVVNVAGTVTNAGTFSATAPCGGCGAGNQLNADLINQGTLGSTAVLTLGKVGGQYQNLGTISVPSSGQVIIPASAGAVAFSQDGGDVSSGASGKVTVRSGTVTINGGVLRQRGASNIRPVLVLEGADLVIAPTATDSVTVGVVAQSTATRSVTGDIPALTRLWLGGSSDGQPATITMAGNPTNHGRILPVRLLDVFGGQLTIGGSGRLTNAGSIDQSQNSGAQATFTYALDVTNTDSIKVIGSNATFSKPGGTYVNNGTIDLGPASSTSVLTVLGSTLTHAAGATMSGGTVSIDAGRLLGTGSIASRIAPTGGGSVEPGLSPGTLNVLTYAPASNGVLRIELGGDTPGSGYDQLIATGSASLSAGSLDIVEVNGFLAGRCGQVFDVLTHSSGSSAATFASVTGLTPGPGRMLRVVYAYAFPPATSYVKLVGFDGAQKICVGPNPVALTEGGAGVQYAIALDHAPTSTVTVTPTADAQVTVTPASLSFTSANWQVPQFFTVTAVDDAVQEGAHSGSVAHAVTTTDATYQGFVPATLVVNITDDDTNLPPVAGNDAATTPEDTPVDIDVLANDSDPEGAAISVTGVGAAAHGSAQVINGGAGVRYIPGPDFNGADSFTYTVADAGGATTTATVSVSVAAVPDAPVAGNDQATTRSGRPVLVTVISNDIDPDGDAMTVTGVTAPAHGSAVMSAGQSVTYQSAAGYAGPDAFTYTIDDGTGRTATATVVITVIPATANTPPVAVADVQQVTTGSSIIRVHVLTNDSDAEGDPLRIIRVSAPSAGSASISGSSILYTVRTKVASDQFTYTIADGFRGTATATVTLTFTPPLPPKTLWTGSNASTNPVDFGGWPYCRYTVWFQNTTITMDPRDGGTATVSTTMHEAAEPGCPWPPLPPTLLRFRASYVSVVGSTVTASFTGHPSNYPQGVARFTGTLSGTTLPGILTFQRTDQPPILNWRVDQSITLR